MPVRELDPDKGNVDEYGSGNEFGSETHIVDVSTENEIDIEVFGAAGETVDNDGGRGGYAIGRGYDVSDVSSLELVVADAYSGYLNGGFGGNAPEDSEDGGNGGGLTVVKRGDTIDIAGHGGGGGFDRGGSDGLDAGGGGGAAGGGGGGGDVNGFPGDESAEFADLGGDGGKDTFGKRRGDPGTGEVLTPSRFDSTDTGQQGNDAHEGLIRIERTPAFDVDITSTNSPVKLGETLEVDADVENLEDGEVTVELELEIEPA